MAHWESLLAQTCESLSRQLPLSILLPTTALVCSCICPTSSQAQACAPSARWSLLTVAENLFPFSNLTTSASHQSGTINPWHCHFPRKLRAKGSTCNSAVPEGCVEFGI